MTDMLPLPQGFRTVGLACGIKSDPTKLDLALFVADKPCAAAGVFTQNLVCGAPVKVSRERLPSGRARAIVINSGNANACTGPRGLEDARLMTEHVAAQLDCTSDDVLVCSTGIIGHYLPMEKLTAGITEAATKLDDTPQAFANSATAIMTTDTHHKQAMREAEIDGVTVRVAGAAKGAAMIGPNMATMLAVVMTDADLSPEDADAMLRHAVDRSFNCISVEGHTSTSDSVLLLASGASGVVPSQSDSAKKTLQSMLDEVTEELATAIVGDAEGASHFITIDVRGLRTRAEAHRIAKTVADGALVKTAVTGNDPNWGRIVSAVGYAGVELTEEDISLSINDIRIYEAGAPVEHDAAAVSTSMGTGHVHIELDLTLGDAAVRFWTCDLTTEYVRLNSEYTT
jgi:glutamate N-acetyltransferase/amino-acid N-acetyltransferase